MDCEGIIVKRDAECQMWFLPVCRRFTRRLFWVNFIFVWPLSFMIVSLLLIAIITAGGLALTYLITDDEPLMWRLATGCVLGSAVSGTAAFVLGLLCGLNIATAAASVLVAAVPLAFFLDEGRKKRLLSDWRRARG